MNSPCAPSLWRGIQLFLGKQASLPACFGQFVFWLIVTGFSLITSPPLFAQTNDNTAPGGRRIARQEWINTLATRHPPGFSLWDFYAARRIYRGLELFGAVNNFTDSRDPNLGAPLPIFRPELGRAFRDRNGLHVGAGAQARRARTGKFSVSAV
jgi:hypothetical protein